MRIPSALSSISGLSHQSECVLLEGEAKGSCQQYLGGWLGGLH